MADILEKGNLFPELLVNEVVNLVKGKSSLAVLSKQTPIAFNGNKIFTFTLDSEIDIVAEGGAKSNGGATVTPVTITPLKVEYGTRISDEFMYASEEAKVEYLKPLAEGFAKKIARGLDIMAIQGINPRTQSASTVIGNNCFDNAVTQTVTRASGVDADGEVEAAIALIEGSEGEVTGMAMAPGFKSDLAALRGTNGEKIYPELAWGNAPSVINGLPVSTNSTLAFNSSTNLAVIGDFENMFKWGYAKEMPIEIIQYGNPDNDATLGDLKGHNQIYVRIEAYLGWGILDAGSFAIIKSA